MNECNLKLSLNCLCLRYKFKYNTVPENYARAFWHTSQLHVSKDSNIPYDRPLLEEFTIIFVTNVSHLLDKNNFLWDIRNFLKKNNSYRNLNSDGI